MAANGSGDLHLVNIEMPTRQDSDNLPVYSPIKFYANRFSTAQKILMAIAVASVIGVSLFLGIYVGNMIQAKPVTKQARQLPLTATTIKTSTLTSKPIKTSPTRPDVTSPTQTDETSATTASSSWRDQPCIAEKQCPEGFSESPVILVSLDGFRAEYLLRNFTPTLQRLRECGAHATHMRASYPSKTFPNHYSIVTGLYPESHGIIDNNMYDPEFGASFSLGSPESFKNRWWQGEPVWNTIEKQNKKAATFFWPGSDVDIQNMTPTYYEVYNGSIPYAVRVNQVLAWLDMDLADRPQFITLYLEEPDKAGHSYGPVADEVNERLAYADSYIELLMDGLFERGLHSCVNVIVLADHGMAPHSCQRVEFLQDYINLNNLYIYQGPNARIDLMEQSLYTPEEILHDTVCRSEHYDAYLKKDAPKRYHHANNRRISPIVIDVEEEWLVGRTPETMTFCTGGTHGWDNRAASMHAIFIAYGPAIKEGYVTKPFPNTEVYNFICELLEVKPAANNGTLGSLHHLLGDRDPLPPPDVGSPDYDGWQFPADQTEYEIRINSSGCDCGSDYAEMWDVDKQLDLPKNESDAAMRLHAPWGVPVHSRKSPLMLLPQQDYALGWSENFQMPLFATYTLDKAFTSVTDERPCVRGDVRIPPGLQPTCDAYSNARRTNVNPYGMFNPGENAPISAVNDSAIMTNMVPMYEGFIQGVWHDVHDYLSQWAQALGPINVVTGPVFDYNIDGNYDDLSMVEFLYNDSSIPLPTHYFLVLTRCLELGSSLADCPATSIDALSFIIPHKEKMENCKSTDEYVFTHSSSLRDVERLTGLSLHPELDFYETMGYRLISRQTLWELNLPSPPPPTTPPPGKWIDQECVTQKVCPAGFETSPVIIVSLDGFRAEYLLRNFTPTFQRMRECGAHATHMQSVYPTKTFPNHYSLATGLYPESHGIIDNSMYDAAFDASFSLGSPEKNNNRWWNGEPIWNTVMKNGKTAATYFWPGSDVDIQDMRPDYFYYYDNRVPDHTRVNQMLHWLEYPANERPDFITAYFESVDGIGHNVDPDTDELNDELAYMDSVIGDLMDGLYQRGLHQCVDIMITADHGMGAISCDRRVMMEDYVYDVDLVKVYQGANSRIAINKSNYTADTLLDAVRCKNDHYNAFRKEEMPKRFHYSNNDRIDEVVLDVEEDWLIAREPSTLTGSTCSGGTHGWDDRDTSMHAIFIGHGPHFKQNYTSPAFPNIELYNLIVELLNVTGVPNNGSYGALHHLLRDMEPLPDVPAGPGYYSSFIWPSDQNAIEERRSAANCNCTYENGDIDLIDSRLNIDISISGPILSKHAPWGAPRVERFTTDDVYLLPHEDYVLGYSSSFKVPLWASFKTDQGHAGFMSELPVCVRADVRLDIDTHARCSDYSNDNAETANITMQALFTPPLNTTTENLYDAAILTNSVPQSTGFTIGVWRQIMDHVTRWAQIYGPLNIVTGPVFDYNYNGVYDTLDETRFIYDGSTLPFPTHYYVLVSKCSGKIQGQQCDEELPEVMAFVIPNRMEQETCQNITDYLFTHTASVRDVERLTGLWFYSDLDYYSSLKMKLLPVQTLWTTDN